MANANGGFCLTCGARMRALFQTFVCPNECDLPLRYRTRKPASHDFGWDDLKTPTDSPPCDSCKSRDTEAWKHPLFNWHCRSCGKVWTHHVNP